MYIYVKRLFFSFYTEITSNEQYLYTHVCYYSVVSCPLRLGFSELIGLHCKKVCFLLSRLEELLA
jgi:hypothetical protein